MSESASVKVSVAEIGSLVVVPVRYAPDASVIAGLLVSTASTVWVNVLRLPATSVSVKL